MSRLQAFPLILLLLVMSVWVYVFDNLSFTVGTDAVFYDDTALSISRGLGFSRIRNNARRAVFAQSPGYSFILAGIYSLEHLFDPTTDALSDDANRILWVAWFQTALTIGTILLFTRALEGVLSKNMQWMLWFGLSSYAPFVVSAWLIAPRAISMSLILLFCIIYLRKPRHWEWYLFGTALFLTFTKPHYVLFLLLTFFLISSQETIMIKKKLFVIGLLGVLLIGGWSIRTYIATGNIVFMQAGVRYVLKTGACPASICPLSESVADGSLFDVIGSIIKIWWWYGVHKTRSMLSLPFGLSSLQFEGTFGSIYSYYIYLTHVLFVLLGLFGSITTWRKSLVVRLSAIIVFMGVSSLLITWSHERYFLPYMAPMIVLSLFGAVEMYSRWKHYKKGVFAYLVWICTLTMISSVEIWPLHDTLAFSIANIVRYFATIWIAFVGLFFLVRYSRRLFTTSFMPIVWSLLFWSISIGFVPQIESHLFTRISAGNLFPVAIQNGMGWIY